MPKILSLLLLPLLSLTAGVTPISAATSPTKAATAPSRGSVGDEQLEEVCRLVAEAEACLKAQGGRILLRYSGTEPKVRLLLEGRDAALLEQWSRKISQKLKEQLA